MPEPIRLLHFADLHLDRYFGWATPELGRERRRAIRAALTRVLDLARSHGVDAVLSAGDLFNVDEVTPDTIAFLSASFGALAPMPVLLAPGNHDWYSSASPYAQAAWPGNVTIFRSHQLVGVPVRPGWTVWGAAHLAPAGTPDLLAGARVHGDGLHLGLLHAAEAWEDQPAGDLGLPLDPHAPFLPREVGAAGLHHLLTGHYHTPRDAEIYTYPGPPEALGFADLDHPGAAVLHEFEPNGLHRRTRFVVGSDTLHAMRLDVTGCTSEDDIRGRVGAALADLRGVVRLDLEGELGQRTALDLRDLEGAAPWLDALLCRDRGLHTGYDLDALTREPTIRGQFVRDVLDPAGEVDEARRERVLAIGLRALAGRGDLVPGAAS